MKYLSCIHVGMHHNYSSYHLITILAHSTIQDIELVCLLDLQIKRVLLHFFVSKQMSASKICRIFYKNS